MRPEPSLEESLEKIKRGTVEVITPHALKEKLKRAKSLKIKAGFDPTTKDIHLGHLVLLKKLRTFQDLGHQVYFLVGDFTARIGDPSGRDTTRPPLSKEEVLDNARTYTQQALKILNPEKTEIVFNSSWFDKMDLNFFCRLLSSYTVARILERDDFQRRFNNNLPISMLEFIYPLLQGYDSVVLEADVEVGGTDQKFNLLCARDIQEYFGKEPQVIITLPLLLGLDGKDKMSKSLGNYIGIDEPPQQIFGKVMSISDDLMYQWYEILTEFDMSQVKKLHPKEAKENLAQEIVSWFYGQDEACYQRERFKKIFSQGEYPQDILAFNIPPQGMTILDILVESGLVISKNEARRLIKQGAVEFSGQKIKEEKFLIRESGLLRSGKKSFLEIKKP